MLRNIKSWFIIEEEPVSPKTGEQKPAKPVATELVRPTANTHMTDAPGTATSEFLDVLFDAMEQQNLDGFDYLEFKQSLHSLEKMPMDEATRYQSAFAMAQTLGATPSRLMETAEHYLRVLQGEEAKFQQAVANQKNKLIGAKEQEIRALEEMVREKSEQIKRLTQEIEAHQQQAKDLRHDIAEATVKVETTHRNFIASYQELSGKIQRDLDNMKRYLK